MDPPFIPMVFLGIFPFMVFWILTVFPGFKLLPIGRTGGALLGAVLTVVFKVETPGNAYAAIDLSILGLLFGTMMVSVYLEKADMFRYLGNLLSWKSRGGKDLLCRLCILSAILSALFTNDTCCVVLTEFVLKLCRQKNLPAKPFLIALATSANIGSVATPIGNPQNLIIAVQSGISFDNFLLGLLPSMVLGVLINNTLLILAYWTQLSSGENIVQPSSSSSDSNEQSTAAPCTPFHSGNLLNLADIPVAEALRGRLIDIGILPPEQTSQVLTEGNGTTSMVSVSEGLSPKEISQGFREGDGTTSIDFTPICMPISAETRRHHYHDTDCLSPLLPALISRETISSRPRWKRRLWKSSVYFVVGSMLAALVYGLDLSWTALTAAVALMVLDFCDAGPHLEKVSYPLLVFFVGMFITVDGFNNTGIPNSFWEIVEPHARITHFTGEIVLTLVVIILSNVASNVPTGGMQKVTKISHMQKLVWKIKGYIWPIVLLMGSRVARSAASTGASMSKAWLILAWASTIGGNLTLLGSAANLIVSEQAAKAQFLALDLNFFTHLAFGFPSTLIIVVSGLFLIRG